MQKKSQKTPGSDSLLLHAEINAAKARKEYAEKIKEDEERKQKKPKLQWTYVAIPRISVFNYGSNTDPFPQFRNKTAMGD